MAPPLLQTKLFIPSARPGLVLRPRLVEQLNAALGRNGLRVGAGPGQNGLQKGFGLARKLTLISAPAGFGKTTLLSEWVQAMGKAPTPIAVAWLALDESDNDPARFLTYLIAALQGVETQQGSDGRIGKGTLSALQSAQPPPAEAVLTVLINELAAIPGRMILVLDDYHLIEAQPIHDALAFLLRHQPPQLHLVIATREDPLLPLARLRARGQLTELRATDLRFTPAEAAQFLNQVMGLDLSAGEVAALEARTEGWIAGLQLAAISMQGQKDVAGFIQSFTGSHHFVLDYLVEEVLQQQSESVREFLLQTSILDRLTGPLCDAVHFGEAGPPAGQEDGRTTLQRLAHANLFTVPLDQEQRWYRYHHLFADLLRQRLRQTQPEQLPRLHIRARDWFKGQGWSREAIKHSLRAGDVQGAARLIKTVAMDTVQQGEHTTVVGWIHALPEELVKNQPYLCVLHAWALQLTGQLEAAEARLTDAERALDNPESQNDEDIDTILGLVHSHRAYLSFMVGEHEQTVYHAERALDRLPTTATLIRVQTALYLGIASRFLGQPQAALDVYQEILPIAQTLGGTSISVLCYLHLGDLYTEMAQLHRAKEVYERALSLTEQHTGRRDLPFCGYVYVSLGRILRQWNQLQDAYRLTVKGVPLCRDWNVADIMALSCIELAYVHQALGHEEQARESVQEAIQIYAGFSPWGVQYASAHQAKIDLQRGDIDAAGRWAQEVDLVTDRALEFHREIEYLALARVFIAQKRWEQARALAERIYRAAQDVGRTQTELEGLILLALIFSIRGETDQALAYLEKALSMGEPEDLIQVFVDEGRPMAHLLYKALTRGIAPDYVRRLLEAFPITEAEPSTSSVVHRPPSALIEPLSDRELEVLQLIAQGLTNPEVASRLFLALNTVKAHTRNIYGKLDVHSRIQAVARARALGLLPST